MKETSLLLFIDIITSFTPTRCQCRSSSVLLVPTLCSTALLYQAGVSFLTSAPGLYLFIYLFGGNLRNWHQHCAGGEGGLCIKG